MKATRIVATTSLALACVGLVLGASKPGTTGSEPPPLSSSAFARNKLHVWAYEEYDAVKRSPAAHARVLTELGLTRAGYICRNAARVALFEEYVDSYRKEGIELVSVWTPVHTENPLAEVQIRTFLEVAARHQLKPQWWLTLEEDFDRLPAAERVERAVSQLRPLVAEGNKRGMRVVLYGHGVNKWFTQAENEIAIVERLKQEMRSAQVGIVYSFHQSFSQMHRFKTVFPRLRPHLAAVNLNGMSPNAKAGTPVGDGTHEQSMIAILHESGWRGPVGILSHNRVQDAKINLQKNLDGLRSLLEQIGDTAGASPY